MDWIDELLEFYQISKEPKYVNPHGKCVGYRQEAYCDVYVYEDGYEEYEDIGD